MVRARSEHSVPASSAADDRSEESVRERSRTVAALGVLAFALVLVVVLWLSLSSRGLSAVGDAADGARVVVRGVENSLDADLVSRSDVPWEKDEVAHLLGWGSLMLVVGVAFRSRRGLGDLAVGVFGASIAIEVAQKLLTTTRRLEAEDISANALGVMLALMVLVALERLVPSRSAQPSR